MTTCRVRDKSVQTAPSIQYTRVCGEAGVGDGGGCVGTIIAMSAAAYYIGYCIIILF